MVWHNENGATLASLMSDDAGYINGAQLAVDGGHLSTCKRSIRSARRAVDP